MRCIVNKAKFYLTETKVMTSYDNSGEHEVSREEVFSDMDFTFQELDLHINKMNYSNVGSGVVSNNSHDNHDRNYFEKGIETTHELKLEKVIDVSGNEMSPELAARVFERRVAMARDMEIDPEVLELF
jgi:ABC-type polar amino acid transport system ATPase subunit